MALPTMRHLRNGMRHKDGATAETVYMEAATAVQCGDRPTSTLVLAPIFSVGPARLPALARGRSLPCPWRPLPLFCPPIANDALFSPWHPSPAAVLGAVSASPPAAGPRTLAPRTAETRSCPTGTPARGLWAPGPAVGPGRVNGGSVPGGLRIFRGRVSRGETGLWAEISVEKWRTCPLCRSAVKDGGAAASHNTHFFSLQWRCSGGRFIRYHNII